MPRELALTACPWQVSINHIAILLPAMVLSLTTKHTVNHAFWEQTEHRLRVTLPFDSLVSQTVTSSCLLSVHLR